MAARAAAITEVVAKENMEKDEENMEKVEEKDEEKVAVIIPSLAAGNRFMMS